MKIGTNTFFAVKKKNVLKIVIDYGRSGERIVGIKITVVASGFSRQSCGSRVYQVGKQIEIENGKLIVTNTKGEKREIREIVAIFSKSRGALECMNSEITGPIRSWDMRWKSDIREIIQEIGGEHPVFKLDESARSFV